MENVVRTHVLLPTEVLSAIDKIAGKRKRSFFLVKAAKEKLANLALLSVLDETAGVIQEDDHPEWRTRKDTANWVSTIRKKDEEVRRR
ncbi:MAG: hypothetical protein AAB267_04790 [Candidatus Desantisbacteria bacterium]